MIIKLDKFEGPLGLLLQLIEKEEMDITEISLAKIADQYIERIKTLAQVKPEETADFLVVAARLLLIKSRALLPYLYPEEDKEIDEFERQLKMYKEFLEAAKQIAGLIERKRFAYARDASMSSRQMLFNQVKVFSPPAKLKMNDLELVFKELLRRIKPPAKLEEKQLEYTINIEEKILAIEQALINNLRFNFNKILTDAGNKTEVIVSFLAMLELIKQRQIGACQNELFSEIIINRS